MSDPIARLPASGPRRIVAATVLSALAALILWLAVAVPNPTAWRLALGLLGLGVALSVRAMWIGTREAVELRAEGLFLSNGRRLVSMDAIAGVDRGMFAIKPSNGFVLRLRHAPGAAWVPGLYWRIGRRIGVGGITDAGAARAMADILAVRLAERARGE